MSGVESSDVADSPSSLSGSEVASPSIPNSAPLEEGDAENKSDLNGKQTQEEEKEENEEWVDILGSGQLKMKVIKKGQPNTRPSPPDICEIKLKGTLDDGSVVEEYDSFKMQLGCHEVVQGIELAVPMMDIEEEAILIVNPRFGYGSIGNPPKIPPNATITYNITLLSSESEPDLEKIPFEVRKSLGSAKKERGNWWYSRQDPTKAIQCYRKALDILDETVPYFDEQLGKDVEYPEEEMRSTIEQKLIVYNNLAAAQLMIEAYDSALMSVDRVLQCEPENVKALFRKGKILKAKGEINEAVKVLKQALTLRPDNIVIKMELKICVKVQQKEIQHEKKLYKKMLGQDKKGDKSSDFSKKKFSYWTKVLGTAATATVMAVIAFAVGYRIKNYSLL